MIVKNNVSQSDLNEMQALGVIKSTEPGSIVVNESILHYVVASSVQ